MPRHPLHRDLDLIERGREAAAPELLAARPERAAAGLEGVRLASAARELDEYQRRPDLGRKLAADSAQLLEANSPQSAGELVIGVSEGLLTLATETHAPTVLAELLVRRGVFFPVLLRGGAALGGRVSGATLRQPGRASSR